MATYDYQAPGYPTDDPLVPDPAAGFGGWYDHVVGAIKRSWKSLLVIAAVTILVPTLVLSLLWAAVPGGRMNRVGDSGWKVSAWEGGTSVVALLLAIAVTILAMYLSALGSAAAVWTITHQAAGRPAELGDALRFGRTRALPLWGWHFLSSILITLGICLCFVGSLYFAIACSMVTPVVVYERAPGIPRSFKLIHAHFGRALARLVPLGLVVLVLACCLSAPASFVKGVNDNSTNWALNAVSSVWSGLVSLLLFVLVISGLVVTYAELRSRETQVSTEQLLAEAS